MEADKCDNTKSEFLDCVAKCHLEIDEKKKDLLEFAESHIKLLHQQLSSLKIKSIKEIEINKEEINIQLFVFESFTRYCQEMVDKATPSDIPRIADEQHSRTRELQDMILVNTFQLPRVKFVPSDIAEELTEDKINIIGIITDTNLQTGVHVFLASFPINVLLWFAGSLIISPVPDFGHTKPCKRMSIYFLQIILTIITNFNYNFHQVML